MKVLGKLKIEPSRVRTNQVNVPQISFIVFWSIQCGRFASHYVNPRREIQFNLCFSKVLLFEMPPTYFECNTFCNSEPLHTPTSVGNWPEIHFPSLAMLYSQMQLRASCLKHTQKHIQSQRGNQKETFYLSFIDKLNKIFDLIGNRA